MKSRKALFRNPPTPTLEDFIAAVCPAAAVILLRVLIGYAPDLAQALSRHLFKSFVVKIAGICLLSQKSTSSKIAEKLGIVSHDSLTRMLNHSAANAMVTMLSLFNQAVALALSTPSPCWLILDDVIIPKRYAKNLEGAYYDWDHVNKRTIFCHRLVVLVWTNGFVTIPVAFALWHKKNSFYIKESKARFTKEEYEIFSKRFPNVVKYLVPFTTHKGDGDDKVYLINLIKILPLLKKEIGKKAFNAILNHTPNKRKYRTKNDLARCLIYQLLRKGLPFDYITFDAWYASKKNLNMLNRLGITYYTALPCSRKIKVSGESLTCKKLGSKFKTSDCSHYQHKQVDFRARSFAVEISGFNHAAKLVMIKGKSWFKHLKKLFPETYKNKTERDPNKFLLTNNTDATTRYVIDCYSSRWKIEVTFRDLKQHLGLCDCQHRKLGAISTYFAISMLSYVCLQYIGQELQDASKKDQKEHLTIGDIKKYLQSQLLIKIKGQAVPEWQTIPELGQLPKKPMETEVFERLMEEEMALMANS